MVLFGLIDLCGPTTALPPNHQVMGALLHGFILCLLCPYLLRPIAIGQLINPSLTRTGRFHLYVNWKSAVTALP